MVHVGVHHQIPRRSGQGKKTVQRLQIVHKKYDIKGTGSSDEYFLETYNIQSVLYVLDDIFFKFLGCLVKEKTNYYDFACFFANPYSF
jgi:hypothetical protein